MVIIIIFICDSIKNCDSIKLSWCFLISKAILDTNNKNFVRSTEIKQWKNTYNLVDWYAITTDKNKASSITSELLHNSIQFAK